MKRMFSITVRATSGTEGRMALIKEWPERMEHVQPMVPYLAADYVHKYIRSKLPRGADYRAYRQGLEVAKVRGVGEGEVAYVVQVNMSSPLVRKIRPNQILLYVHAKKRATRTDPAVAILEKYNPWTVDSLPFTPDPKLGYVKTKKVRGTIVVKTTTARQRQRSAWSRELNNVGHRDIHKDRRLKIPKKVQILPAIALEAMKLEFGLGGSKQRPFWRLGVRHALQGGIQHALRNPKYLVFPLTKPSYKLWKKWPPRTKHFVQVAQVKKYGDFQKKLGLHVRR